MLLFLLLLLLLLLASRVVVLVVLVVVVSVGVDQALVLPHSQVGEDAQDGVTDLIGLQRWSRGQKSKQASMDEAVIDVLNQK